MVHHVVGKDDTAVVAVEMAAVAGMANAGQTLGVAAEEVAPAFAVVKEEDMSTGCRLTCACLYVEALPARLDSSRCPNFAVGTVRVEVGPASGTGIAWLDGHSDTG